MAKSRVLLASATALVLLAAIASVSTANRGRHRSAVYLNPSSPKSRVTLFDPSLSAQPPSLSNDDATDLVSYLAGASRGADLSRLPTLAVSSSGSGADKPSWMTTDKHRHVMVDVEGLDTSDIFARPSFIVSHDSVFDVPNQVAKRVRQEYANDDAQSEIQVSIAELEDVIAKLRNLAGTNENKSPDAAPRFATIRVNGVNPRSREYQSQVTEVKKLMDKLGSIPDVTTSLVARPPSAILAHDDTVLTAQSVSSDAVPAIVLARDASAASASPISSTSFSPLLSAQPLCFDSEAKCKADTKDCSGQGACSKTSATCWTCACKPGYAGASCILYDVTTPLFLTFGVGFVLVLVAFAGVGLLASAAPSDAAAAVGVSSASGAPGAGGGSGAGTRAD
ncbi:hypothetical protein BCR44DRAFT_51438 [Catenaria anguillulae PL171]|uniref:EGF-like domain-containing protein n=1 Tax=Catenaria anguillulae PL171 TaxID=765915 RepID=A0A1Y2HTI1_9FUNG|nr:hypothetical protein BCR44DRAFT_51438 [Catenaria anguillulae PL171]